MTTKTNPVWVQNAFRGRNDDGNETTATWKANANTNWTQAVDTVFRLRFDIRETAGATTLNTPQFILQSNKNSAGWVSCSTSGTTVIYTASSLVTDDAQTTQQLSSGTFEAGRIDETGSHTALGAMSNEVTDMEWVLTIPNAGVVNGDTIQIRVVLSGATTLNTYSQTPTITVSEATVYTQTTAGTLTSAGTVVRKTGKVTAGTITTAGVALKKASKILAGALSSSGVLGAIKTVLLALAGTLTSAGALVNQSGKVLSGAVTSAGVVLKQVNKILAGSATSSGVLLKQTSKILAGTLTSSGVLAGVKTALVSLAGTLTSAGTVIKQTGKSIAGTLTTSGTITKQVNKVIAGAVTSSGVLIKSAGKILSGTVTSAGTLIKAISKIIAGTLTSAGTLLGELASTGTTYYQALAGALTSSGILSALAVFNKGARARYKKASKQFSKQRHLHSSFMPDGSYDDNYHIRNR